MRASSHIPLDMDLTAGERELERVLAELTPATTPGIVTVPAKEMALRAGNIRARQRLRVWQAGTVLLTAGWAAARYFRPQDGETGAQVSAATDIPLSEPFVIESRTTDAEDALTVGPVWASGQIVIADPNAPHKIILWGSAASGDVSFALVPLDWEVCEH